MLDPRNLVLTRSAFVGDMILVGIDNAYVYDNGKRTDVISAVRCNVVLPAHNYERLAIKLPVGTEVDPRLVGKPVDFLDFAAKMYVMNGRTGFSVTATGIHAAKSDKP